MLATNYYVDSVVTVVTIKPKSLIKTLSEIGGLLILLRVSMLIAFTHEKLFDCKMRKGKGDQDDFKDVFTYDNFKETVDRVKE